MATAGPIQSISALAEQEANRRCAECRLAASSAVSVDCGGAFVCHSCASLHRQLGFRTKCVRRDRWQEAEVAALSGNAAVAQSLERCLPPFYRRPRPGDPAVVGLQFLVAKYRRREFTDVSLQRSYHSVGGGGFAKSGALMKRLKRSDKFAERHFELSERDNFLRYFQPHRKTPKATIAVDHVNVALLGNVIDSAHPHLLHIFFPCGSRQRSLYAYHEDGQELAAWYNAIRGCKHYRRQMSLLPSEPPLTHDVAIADWLSKTGPRLCEPWRRRWCFVLRRCLFYCTGLLDPHPRGRVFLGDSPGCRAFAGPPPEFRKKPIGHLFTVSTPARHFVFAAESAEACGRWLQTLELLLQQPPTPQDITWAS